MSALVIPGEALMRKQLIGGLLRLLSWLPLRANHALGGLIGFSSWLFNGHERKVTELNLSLCYPGRTDLQKKLCRKSLIETGKSITELGWFWCRPKSALLGQIVEVRGLDIVANARKNRSGLIMISPHIGAWELAIAALSEESRLLFMYRPPRQKDLDPILRAGRSRFGAELLPLTPGGIKTVLRGLRDGATVGMLPDQEPDRANGTFANFFGVPANTMNLINRLANRSNAGMVFMVVERLAAGKGYRVEFTDANDDIRSADPDKAANALNRDVETCINRLPTQYIWSYKRFRLCEDGTRRPYS